MSGLKLFAAYASIVSLLISLATLIYVYFIDDKVKKIQYSNLLDKRGTQHLKDIDELLKELNFLLSSVSENEIRIKEILVNLLSQFESILPKLNNSSARSTSKRLINLISRSKNKQFYDVKKTEMGFLDNLLLWYKSVFNNMLSSRAILDIYITSNEINYKIVQLRLDKKAEIK